MPARPLALAALLLLTPAPAVAQPVAEAGPATVAESPAEIPAGDAPMTGAPEAPEDSPAPAEADAGDGAAPQPDGPPAPDGSSAPAEESDAAAETEADSPGAGGSAEHSAVTNDPEGAGTTGPGTSTASQDIGSGHSGDPGRAGAGAVPHGAPAAEGSQVAPGTVDRVPLGALTRVPAQDADGLFGPPAAVWGLVVSGVAAIAAAVLLVRRWRTSRH